MSAMRWRFQRRRFDSLSKERVKRLLRSRLTIVTLVGLFVLGGVAYASIPAADGTFTGCVATNGTLRLIDTTGGSKCSKGQTKVEWKGLGGTVTQVDSGFGLTGGPITTAGTLAADSAVLQRRVGGSCTANKAVQSVNQDGSVGCSPNFVNSIIAGSGLNGGTVTTNGTISVDTSTVQSRVGGSCGGNHAIQSINQNGTVSCSTSFAPAGAVAGPAGIQIARGQQMVVISGNGVEIVNDCTDPSSAKVLIREQPGQAGAVLVGDNVSTHSLTVDGNAVTPYVVGANTPSIDQGNFSVLQTTGTTIGQVVAGYFSVVAQASFCQVISYAVLS